LVAGYAWESGVAHGSGLAPPRLLPTRWVTLPPPLSPTRSTPMAAPHRVAAGSRPSGTGFAPACPVGTGFALSIHWDPIHGKFVSASTGGARVCGGRHGSFPPPAPTWSLLVQSLPSRSSCQCPMFMMPSVGRPLHAPRSSSSQSLHQASARPGSPHPLCRSQTSASHLGCLRRSAPSSRWKLSTSRWTCDYMLPSKWSPNWTRLKILGGCHPRSFPSMTLKVS
jgi:hypothetical protein